MPVTIYFGAVSAVLYHVGAMQAAILVIGWIIRKIMATTTVESFVAAANIFFGPVRNIKRQVKTIKRQRVSFPFVLTRHYF